MGGIKNGGSFIYSQPFFWCRESNNGNRGRGRETDRVLESLTQNGRGTLKEYLLT